MGREIDVGTVLIKKGTRLPGRMRLECAPLSEGWKLVIGLDAYALSRRIREAGWAFAHMSGEVNATALNFSMRRAVHRAATRGLAKRASSGITCLEIIQVMSRRVFGLAYVTVVARPRSILEEVAQLPSRSLSEWHRAKRAGV